MFDLEAYLARIGLSGRPGVRELHRAHSSAIAFENLDPQRGVAVSLELTDLQHKLVEQRRGGYCFEQNLLLKAALEALGAEVELLLARVRRGGAPGVVRPRSHLLLRVRAEGSEWHADVGFGLGSLLEPLPFGPGAEHEQEGWRFRVVIDGPEHVLQTVEGGEWVDLYGFPLEAVPPIDVETINWWASTNPRSPFVTGLIVTRTAPDGTRLALSDWAGLALSERTPGGSVETPLERAAVPDLLAERFGLKGFTLDVDGRIVLSG